MNSKIHRCGFCGQPVDEHGFPLEKEPMKKAIRILKEYGDHRTHKEHGECCVHDEMARQEQDRWVTVTRDMAHDAGMPEIEGMRTRW